MVFGVKTNFRNTTSQEILNNPAIKGAYTKNYMNIMQNSNRPPIRVLPNMTLDMMEEKLGRMRLKGINVLLHGHIFEDESVIKNFNTYYQSHIFKDLYMAYQESQRLGLPVSRQYRLECSDKVIDENAVWYGNNEDGHLETVTVTPHGALLLAGPYDVNPNRLIGVSEKYKELKSYTADASIFVVEPKGSYSRSAEGIYLGSPNKLFKYYPLANPVRVQDIGAFEHYGAHWVKVLSKNKGEMLKHTLLVDLPGVGPNGFVLPPPMCLALASSKKYIKLITAMVEYNACPEITHEDEYGATTFQITTLHQLMSLEIPMRRASDGKRMSDDQLLEFRHEWMDLQQPAEEWHGAREVNGEFYGLQCKANKTAGYEIPKEFQIRF